MDLYIGPGVLIVGALLFVFGIKYLKNHPLNRQDHIDKMSEKSSH